MHSFGRVAVVDAMYGKTKETDGSIKKAKARNGAEQLDREKISESAYFCNTGLISILSVFPDGKCVEVGFVGKEGFVGLPLLAGFRTTPTGLES